MRGGRVLAVAALLAGSVAACGDDADPVAAGADVDRPAVPAMSLVRFEDVAADVGLDFRHGAFRWDTGPDAGAMMGGGLCWVDYDRDGWLDLFVTNTWANGEWGAWREQGALPASALFRNDAGTFVDVTESTGTGLETRANGCVAADLDLDGWTDLYVTTERENVLLWNESGSSFVADANASGVDAFGWHSGAAVGDVDGNGWPDLFVAGYADLNRPIAGTGKGFPNTFEPEPDLLFLNDGPTTDGQRVAFREVAGDVGIEPDGPDYGLGAVLTDLDGDGDLDLYVANDTTPNDLYENRGFDEGLQFVERGIEAGVGDDGAGMGVASGDGNGDRGADLVVTNQLDERHGAWWNAAGADGLLFEDARTAMGQPRLGAGSTGWGVIWADVDLDTDLDLFFAHGAIPVRDLVDDREPLLLLENHTAEPPGGAGAQIGAFSDASATAGVDVLGPFLARGAAAADFDNDGDVDIALGSIGGALALLRNGGAGGNWIVVDAGVPVPGARVAVTLADGTVLVRELLAGSSYLSSEDPRAHFGLGAADRVAELEVRWPNGDVSTLTDVEVDRIVRLEPPEPPELPELPE